jgi:cytochrome c553
VALPGSRLTEKQHWPFLWRGRPDQSLTSLKATNPGCAVTSLAAGSPARCLALLAASAGLASASPAADFPAWAYPVPVETAAGAPDDGIPRHVAGSAVAFTRARLAAYQTGAPDWFPADHPPMPAVVGLGRPPSVWACAYCHLPNGAGRPENASLAGLTAGYIRQQVANFRNGAREGSEPRRGPQTLMISISKALTDGEIAQAAAYFAALKPEAFVRVVESATAPRSFVAGSMMAKVAGGGMEPTGSRIVEVPEDLTRAQDRDPRTPYVAYVPVGSLKRGAELVLTGAGGKTLQCVTCHGPSLNGLGDIPRITGRSPSYTMRQLYDLRDGKRSGPAVLMTVVVARLTDDDMLAIAAYLASLAP